MPSTTSLLLAAGLSVLATAQQSRNQTFLDYADISNTTTSDCPGSGGAHIIVARASTEPLGYGVIGAVKDDIITANPASNAEYVVYPATLTDYFDSESQGVSGMAALVSAFLAKDCPNDPPIVLMGYSQGAQVVADYIAGQSDNNFPYNETLTQPASEDVLSRLAAAITMGDPSINITDSATHVGNSTKGGIFERRGNSSMVLNGIADKVQAYCDALDPYCASAGNFTHISVHLGYVSEYGMDATEFVLKKIEEYYGQGSGANGTSGTNGTAGSGASPTQSGGEPEYTGAAASMRVGGTIAVVMAMGIALACGL